MSTSSTSTMRAPNSHGRELHMLFQRETGEIVRYGTFMSICDFLENGRSEPRSRVSSVRKCRTDLHRRDPYRPSVVLSIPTLLAKVIANVISGAACFATLVLIAWWIAEKVVVAKGGDMGSLGLGNVCTAAIDYLSTHVRQKP